MPRPNKPSIPNPGSGPGVGVVVEPVRSTSLTRQEFRAGVDEFYQREVLGNSTYSGQAKTIIQNLLLGLEVHLYGHPGPGEATDAAPGEEESAQGLPTDFDLQSFCAEMASAVALQYSSHGLTLDEGKVQELSDTLVGFFTAMTEGGATMVRDLPALAKEPERPRGLPPKAARQFAN